LADSGVPERSEAGVNMAVFPVLQRLSVVSASVLLVACNSGSMEGQGSTAEQVAAISYMDQTPPGQTPIQFAPHIFVDELHASLVFSADGDLVFWSEMGGDQVRVMERGASGWSPAQNVPFALPGGTSEPMLAPDGETLFFLSSEPIDGARGEHVWRVRRTSDGWTVPEPLGPGVNNHPLHWSVSTSIPGTLYFGHAGGDRDIYRSEFRDGAFQDAVSVGQGVNTRGHETTPFIAPDESYLLFSRSGAGSMADLYVSFPDSSGNWQEAVSLGDAVNTVANHELCPVVSPDGEYLFFIRNVDGDLKPHWVRSSVFLDLRPGGNDQ